MKSEIKQPLILGVVILSIVVVLSLSLFVLDSQTLENASDESKKTNSEQKINKFGYKKAPELAGISGYVNTVPEELGKKIKNSVVLYDIWTYSCINCVRTLPFITSWDEKYADQGLLIIGIHSPEFEFEKDVENVKNAVAKYGIKYPVVLDNEKETWKAFENNYWPRKYIADHEGYIRYDHIGEGGYDETEKIIQKLLKERADTIGTNMMISEELVQINEFEHSSFVTPELYFGFNFAVGRNQLGNSEGFIPNQNVTYAIPDSLKLHHYYLDGIWTNLEDKMRLVSDSGRIILPYTGKQVNIVTGGEANLEILLDGKQIPTESSGSDVSTKGQVHTHYSGLYNIIETKESEQHILEIIVNDSEFEIFTFTFG